MGRTPTTLFVKRLVIVIMVCIIFGALVLSGYLVSKKHHSDAEQCPKQVEYDFDTLSLRWNPTLCNKHKCIFRRDRWEIHGLWQDYKNGSYPQFCCNSSRFDLELIKPLVPKLNVSMEKILSSSSLS